MNIIDTPGFGDFLNNEEAFKPIIENIESRYDSYLEQENKVHRKKMTDTRVHACLYFIAPTGHGLRALDLEFMKRLASRVNVIPVIAKADTLTPEEVKGFKQRILEDIQLHQIPIYRPQVYDNDDSDTIKENQAIRSRIPFAVVGSDREVDAPALSTTGVKEVRGRKYPWCVVDVDNEDHCDFVKLRQMLIRTHMEELKEHTQTVLYENYRTIKVRAGALKDLDAPPAAIMMRFEDERKQHEVKMVKMEQEMKLVFQQKVQEKEMKLKVSEEELYARHREMKEALERQRMELEEKRRRLDGKPPTPEKQSKKKPGLFK